MRATKACGEICDLPLYDTVYTLAPRAPGRVQLFGEPIGAAQLTNKGHQTKTEIETNLFEPNMLSFPQSFVVRALRVAMFSERELVPVNSRYYADTLVEFTIAGKTYWQGPAFKCADPAAVLISSNLFHFSTEERKELIRSVRCTFEPPNTIGEKEEFSVSLEFGALWSLRGLAAPEKIMVLLEGHLFRPVQ